MTAAPCGFLRGSLSAQVTTVDPIAPDNLVASRYRLLRRLGAGAQGEVWEVSDAQRPGVTLALKRSSGPEARREAQALFQLEHPSLPAALDCGTTARGDAWLVMARVEGEPLDRCAPDVVLRAAAQIADALGALHDAGIVHGDVKPANIVAQGERAWLLDLGLSTVTADEAVYANAHTAGTLRYLAPEALAGERGPAGDLWSLGVTLVECLGGAHPFVDDPDDADALLRAAASNAPPRAEVLARCPDAVREALRALLAREPERRPPSARAWRDRWCRDAGLPTPADADLEAPETLPVRTALVGRAKARHEVLDALREALHGLGLGAVITGPSGAGRRRLADEVLRALRIEGAAAGAMPDVRVSLPEELQRPTVLCLLDADDEQIARAAEALRRLQRFDASPVPFALLATAGGGTAIEGLRAVALHPLDRGEVRELLGALQGAPVPPPAVDAWIDATAGLPGRIVSLARELTPARLVNTPREELFARAASLHRARLPTSLPADARRAASLLALAGGSLPRAALTEVTGPRALAVLTAAGHAHTRGRAAVLTTPFECDAPDRADTLALDRALARLAPRAHLARARTAHALEHRAAAWEHCLRAVASPEVSRPDAVRALERCADDAPDRAAYALARARTLLLAGEASRALEALADAPRSPELRTLELDALRRAGRRDDARARARALADEEHPDLRALARLADARDALDQGDPLGADETLGDLSDDESLGLALRTRALELDGLIALTRGDVDRARERLDRADSLARTSGDLAARARTRSLLGMTAQRAGDHDLARRCFHDAWSLACEAGDAHAAATCLVNLGGAELDCGSLGEALRALTRAARSLAALGRLVELARALANVASLHAWIGDRDTARDLARRALDAAHAVGDAVGAAFAQMVAADALDDPRAAGNALLDAARTLADAGDDTRADEARARAVLRLLDGGALDEALHASHAMGPHGALPALARVALALARHASPADLSALQREAAGAVSLDAAAESALIALRLDAACARATRDESAATRALAALRARVDALAATLPADLGARFTAQHGPREESPVTAARDAARWRRLIAITHRLNDEPRLRALLELVMDAIVELTGASRGFLLLRGDDGALRIRTARNLGQRDLDGDDMAFSRSVAERVAHEGEALVTVDASADGRFNTSASVTAMQLRSILAVPLRVHGEVVGTVYVDDRFRVGAFDDDAVEVARAFADAAAVAIHNARARADLQRALRRAERLSGELERRVDAQRVELDAVRQTLAAESARGRYEGLIGRGPAMARLLGLVDRVAPTAMSVLLQGESGTGKELIARAIHANSARAARPFVAENCGAIPETLLESVLFGHVRGAFTGADRNRAGLFEVADGGTLFLDEVGEMSPAMQAKLLRVLQEGEVRPVGGERSRRVDVRVIAATHRDLPEMVRRGTFREDLFYRLAVMVLPVPALRERREDIPALVAHLLQRHGHGALQIDRRAMARLVGAPWPGNVRQLENELQRAAVLADGIIREEDLTLGPAAPESPARGARREGAQPGLDLRNAVEDVEREMVERALREQGWNQSRAAKVLGLSRFGLQKKLKRLGIPSRDPQAHPRAVR